MFCAMRCRFIPARSTMPQIQSFLEIDAPLFACDYSASLAPEQDANPGDAVAYARLDDLFDALPTGAVIARSLWIEVMN
jgi:hypothetical protein